MDCSIGKIEREISINGIEFDKDSVYDRLCKLTDLRGVNGRRYRLEVVLMIVIMAKLCGEDTPLRIAEWAKHRQAELVKLLGLSRSSMPSHHTYRRILACKVYAEEVERLVGETTSRAKMARCTLWMAKRCAACVRKTRRGTNIC